ELAGLARRRGGGGAPEASGPRGLLADGALGRRRVAAELGGAPLAGERQPIAREGVLLIEHDQAGVLGEDAGAVGGGDGAGAGERREIAAGAVLRLQLVRRQELL